MSAFHPLQTLAAVPLRGIDGGLGQVRREAAGQKGDLRPGAASRDAHMIIKTGSEPRCRLKVILTKVKWAVASFLGAFHPFLPLAPWQLSTHCRHLRFCTLYAD
jgi:hypothetical protein